MSYFALGHRIYQFSFLLHFYVLQQSFWVESWWGNFTCNREAAEFGLYVIVPLPRPFFLVVMYLRSLYWLILFSSFLFSDLRENRLSGQMPDEIGDCSSLKNLYVSSLNWIQFIFIPHTDLLGTLIFIVFLGTCHLMKLEGISHFLFLSWNNWRICEYFMKLPFKLKFLSWEEVGKRLWQVLILCKLYVRILKNNQLIGPIPSTLSQIPNLKIL